jgi:cysteine desulfurase
MGTCRCRSPRRGGAAPGVGLVALSVSGHKSERPSARAPSSCRVTPASRRSCTAAVSSAGCARARRTSPAPRRWLSPSRMPRPNASASRAAGGARRSALVRHPRRDPGCRAAGRCSRPPRRQRARPPAGAVGETMLFLLDQEGISVSTGSACQAGVAEPSHVVLALGRDQDVARSVLRSRSGAPPSQRCRCAARGPPTCVRPGDECRPAASARRRACSPRRLDRCGSWRP